MNQFLTELRRRNVFRVAAAYLVVGWMLIQIVTQIEGPLSLPEWTDTLVIVLLGISFPVAMLLAWAFEMTPEGMKKTSAADEAVGFRPLGGTDFVLIGLMVTVLGMIGYQMLNAGQGASRPAALPDATMAADDEVGSASASVRSDLSIAVLPFADLSATGDQAYFGDGMAEDILNLLARIENLDVTSRTSAFQYRGDEFSIPEIATALNVRHVLEGSVRKDGDVVRITAQLIDAEGDRHLWSETFDRPLTAGALFAVQDEISAAIVRALGETLDIDVIAPEATDVLTDSVDAYELYLEARDLLRARSDFERVELLLARAVGDDPNFAAAWALRAAATILRAGYRNIDLSRSEIGRVSLEYADRALAINPQSARALAVRGFVRKSENEAHIQPSHDWAAILADFDAALAIDQNSLEALNWRGTTELNLGYPAVAQETFLQCINLDPYYAACHTNYCARLIDSQDDEAALQCHRDSVARGLNLSPGLFLELFARAGDERAFMMTLNDSRVLPGWNRNAEIYEAFRNRDADHASLRNQVEAHLEHIVTSHYLDRTGVELIVPMGGEANTAWPLWGASTSQYRRSPAFINHIRQTGVLAYWREHGFPPQCRPVGTDDFECD